MKNHIFCIVMLIIAGIGGYYMGTRYRLVDTITHIDQSTVIDPEIIESWKTFMKGHLNEMNRERGYHNS